jgi:hypothetical protein
VAGAITGPGQLSARGANGSGGGGGGGGVIWVATRSYDGGLTADVAAGTGGTGATAGTARIFQIGAGGDLTERSFGESW